MTEFTERVRKYCSEQNIHPIVLLYPHDESTDKFLLKLIDCIEDTVPPHEIRNVAIVKEDKWEGVFVELDKDYCNVNKTTNSIRTVYDKFDERDLAVAGFNVGAETYSITALEYLGEGYFKLPQDVFTGPTIE